MIRPATHDDLGALLVLAEQMHGESRFARRRFSLDKMARLFTTLIDSEDGLVLVAERNGEIVGGFAGYVAEDWFGPDLMSGDFGLFISEQARGGSTAARLIKTYSAWARSRGAQPEAGISTGVHTETTTRLYEALGYERIGILLAYREQ